MTSDILKLASPVAPSLWRRVARRFGPIFWVTVAVPTLVASIYFFLLASDVYISESRFVVRSPERSAPSGLSALLAGVGISRSHDDTYTVHGYVMSRDALRELEAKAKLREAFSSGDIDFMNRFPGPGRDSSFEALYDHYLGHISIAYDSVSSITTLQVRAYDAKKAQEIDELLLQMSEHLLNNLNDRSRKDLIEVAKREVESAEARVRTASLALSGFRSKNNVFDPVRESSLQVDNITRLKEELRIVDQQLARLRQLSPANPQIGALTSQAAQLRKTIDEENQKIVGGGVNSLANKSPVYERLLLDKSFADGQLQSAMASLEGARNDAARKQLYLERLVQPNLPDVALEPRRLRSVLTVFVIGLLFWGVVSLLVAGVREHAD